MAPITNLRKIIVSHVWKVQKFLMRWLEQPEYDFENKGIYNPLVNRKDQTKAEDWSTLRKNCTSVNWDNSILAMDLNALPTEDQQVVKSLLNDDEKQYERFQSNMKNLTGKKVRRNPFAKSDEKVVQSMLIIFFDANGVKNYSLNDCVAYVRHAYEDNSFDCMLSAAMSTLADEEMTTVIKEVKGANLQQFWPIECEKHRAWIRATCISTAIIQ